MPRLIERAAALLCTALAVLLIGAMLLNCANVLMRYVFATSYLASDELQVFAMIAITFLGALVVGVENRHLRMDVFIQSMPGRVQAVMASLDALLMVAVCGATAWYSWGFVERVFASGQRSGMADLPMWIPQGTVTACFAGLALLAALRLARVVASKPRKQ